MALIEELQINRRSLEEDSRKLKGDPANEETGALVPSDRMAGAYRSFLLRIGLLSAGEVSKVMEAYLSLETYTARLFLVGVPVRTSPRHAQVPARNAGLPAGVQEGMLEPIDQAIETLEGADDACWIDLLPRAPRVQGRCPAAPSIFG